MSYTLSELAEQEATLRFSTFTHDHAFEIGVALRDEAKAVGVAVTIDVTAFGQTLFHHAMEGTSPDNDHWIERKRAVVERFHRASFRVGRELAESGLTIEERSFVDSFEFSPHGGCFPIRIAGSEGVIGTICVSGLPQEEDHRLVTKVIARFTV